MANIILFGDSTPRRNVTTTDDPWYLHYSTHTGGTAAIASHLRKLGYSVLLVPQCTQLSLAGVKQIIENNSDGLIWVGLSTSLFLIRTKKTSQSGVNAYRQTWQDSPNLLINNDITDIVRYGADVGPQLIWHEPELNLIAEYLDNTYQIPLLIGGAGVSLVVGGGLNNLHKNIHIVSGRAEKYVEEITKSLSQNKFGEIPYIVDNTIYDDGDYKNSSYIWESTDNIQPDEWLPLEVARGCAFNCSFCTYDRKSTSDSYKNPTALRDELIRNYELYGVTKYMVVDDLYNDSRDKVRILHDKVWSNLPFKPEWSSFMRLDMLWSDPESAEIIKQSGARMGSFGIETLHNKAGSKIGKGLGKERILETLTMLKEVWGQEVLIHGLFIMGLPDEPEDHILETIKWLQTTDLIYSYNANPLMLTPPSWHQRVNKVSKISAESDNYGITWLQGNNWINKQGVTFQRANELVDIAVNIDNVLTYGFGDYPELRKMGFTHHEIANFKTNNLLKEAKNRQKNIKNKISANLNKLLSKG